MAHNFEKILGNVGTRKLTAKGMIAEYAQRCRKAREDMEAYALHKRVEIEVYEKLKSKADEFVFIVGEESYQKYLAWRLSVYGHGFNFHIDGGTYSITVLNKRAKEQVSLGEGYFYRFPDFYKEVCQLYSPSKTNLLEKIAEALFGQPDARLLEKDREIFKAWQKLIQASELVFKISPEQHKQYQAWIKKENVEKHYFSFEDANVGFLESVVDAKTGKSIDITDDSGW